MSDKGSLVVGNMIVVTSVSSLATRLTVPCFSISVRPGIHMKVTWVDKRALGMLKNLNPLSDDETDERVLE